MWTEGDQRQSVLTAFREELAVYADMDPDEIVHNRIVPSTSTRWPQGDVPASDMVDYCTRAIADILAGGAVAPWTAEVDMNYYVDPENPDKW